MLQPMSDRKILTLEDLERSGSIDTLHQAVETAIEVGDTAETDRLLAIWSKFNRRRRALSSLKTAAQLEADVAREETAHQKPIQEMCDEEVCAALERLVGRPFTIAR